MAQNKAAYDKRIEELSALPLPNLMLMKANALLSRAKLAMMNRAGSQEDIDAEAERQLAVDAMIHKEFFSGGTSDR